jgi:glycosyltransferase involved in cell wall biosynthesis
LDDIEFSGIYDQYKNAQTPYRRLRTRLTWYKTHQYLGELLHRFTVCTVVSSHEQSLLQSFDQSQERVRVIPNGVDVDFFHPGAAEPEPDTLIYPGSLAYQANYDAVEFFLSEIYPTIQAAFPAIKIKITGSHENVDVISLKCPPSCTLTGFIDDIRPVIAAAWVCVVPLRQGSGTRLKILEALALGTPVVTTSKGMQGLDLLPETHLLVADQPQEFARQVIRLLNDPGLRMRLVEAGRRRIEELYSWDMIGTQFLSMVNQANLAT